MRRVRIEDYMSPLISSKGTQAPHPLYAAAGEKDNVGQWGTVLGNTS